MAYDFETGYQPDSKIQKLMLLFVFESMAIPLTEATVLDLCTSDNNWLSYMDCKQHLNELIETNLLYNVPKSQTISITQDGRSCLNLFYNRIPATLRDSITHYTRENRMKYKRRQSYFCDYSKLPDGSHLVIMKINNDTSTLMELRMVVADRRDAKHLYKTWVDKASQVYEILNDTLLD